MSRETVITMTIKAFQFKIKIKCLIPIIRYVVKGHNLCLSYD